MHGCEALLAFLQFPLALQSVFAHHFVAWSLFLAWRPCFAAKGKRKTESWVFKNWFKRHLDIFALLRSLSSNSHNFFVSNPNHAPFEDDYAKLNGNVAAAPNFATVRHIFEVLPGAQIMHTIYKFKA